MSKQIFWIASFPKSGNTLIRSILTSIFFTKDGNFTLDKLRNISQFERTDRIKKNKKIFGEDYNKLNNTANFYKYIKKLQTKEALELKQDFMFMKTHSGLFEIGGNSFTSKENTRGIIYIIRDPRDVCISWSKHLNISFDKSIDNMINDLATSEWVEPNIEIFDKEKRPKSLFSSWEKHVLSWTSNNWDVPLKIIKFEDLVYNKQSVIEEIVLFFEKNFGFNFKDIEKKIKNILVSTEFNKLKKEEEIKGFSESSNYSNFFSVGKKEQWRNKLSENQIKILETKLGDVMKRFNYKLKVEF